VKKCRESYQLAGCRNIIDQ